MRISKEDVGTGSGKRKSGIGNREFWRHNLITSSLHHSHLRAIPIKCLLYTYVIVESVYREDVQ